MRFTAFGITLLCVMSAIMLDAGAAARVASARCDARSDAEPRVRRMSGHLFTRDLTIAGDEVVHVESDLHLVVDGTLVIEGNVFAVDSTDRRTGVSITLQASKRIVILGTVRAGCGWDSVPDEAGGKGGDVIIDAPEVLLNAPIVAGNGGRGGPGKPGGNGGWVWIVGNSGALAPEAVAYGGRGGDGGPAIQSGRGGTTNGHPGPAGGAGGSAMVLTTAAYRAMFGANPPVIDADGEDGEDGENQPAQWGGSGANGATGDVCASGGAGSVGLAAVGGNGGHGSNGGHGTSPQGTGGGGEPAVRAVQPSPVVGETAERAEAAATFVRTRLRGRAQRPEMAGKEALEGRRSEERAVMVVTAATGSMPRGGPGAPAATPRTPVGAGEGTVASEALAARAERPDGREREGARASTASEAAEAPAGLAP